MSQTVQLLTDNQEPKVHLLLTQDNEEQEFIYFFIGFGKQKFALDVDVTHESKNSKSRLIVRGVLFDHSQATLKGCLSINSGSDLCDAYLEERILLIGDYAHARVDPVLKVGNNEVMAVHKVAISPVDMEQLFYLQARGLDVQLATKTIIIGFLQSTIDTIQDPKVREHIQQGIDTQLEQYV